jgi:hypothetical protein
VKEDSGPLNVSDIELTDHSHIENDNDHEHQELLTAAIHHSIIIYTLKGYILIAIGLLLNFLWLYLIQMAKQNIQYVPQ